MPALVRLYIRQVISGAGLAVAFTSMLLWLDVGGLWRLVNATEEGPLAVAMLVTFNTIVFAGVQFAIAVMLMAEDDQRGGGSRAPVTPAPAKVAAATADAEGGGNRSSRGGVNFPRA